MYTHVKPHFYYIKVGLKWSNIGVFRDENGYSFGEKKWGPGSDTTDYGSALFAKYPLGISRVKWVNAWFVG